MPSNRHRCASSCETDFIEAELLSLTRPPSPPPSPSGPSPEGSRIGALAILTIAGVAAVGALAVFGGAQPSAAAVAGGVVAVCGLLLALSPWDSSAPEPAAAEAGAAVDTPAPLFVALEALPDPFVIVEGGEADDFAGRRIVFANAAARVLWRIPPEGALLVAAVRRPEVLEAVDESLYGRVARTAAFEAGGAQDRAWRVSTLPLADPAGETVEEPARRYALLLLRDETDSRRAERMRVDFLANASHELRTPLASLAGFIETLRGHAREDPAARDRFLAIMAAQAERMARLVEDLLSLSRVELNEHVPPAGRCDLALAVADVVDALQPLSTARGVHLDLKLPARGSAVVAGDRDQILQVAQNLIDNALKYSPAGGSVAVEVRGDLPLEAATAAPGRDPRYAGGGRAALLTPDRPEDDGRFVLLRVADSGPGMTREHLPRLTERFYRIEGQKSGEREGTGLGLAIVKHIVNRHRGGLLVESAPGEGATFTAYLPAAEPVPAPALVAVSPPPGIVTKAS